MEKKFLPVFAVNRLNLLKKLQPIEGEFGVLATFIESDNFLTIVREQGKPFFIDSGVFEQRDHPWRSSLGCPWYYQMDCKFEDDRWIREPRLADQLKLRALIQSFFARCDKFTPDYVFPPDVLHEPLLSLYLARIAWEEYSVKPRAYSLIGVAQVGQVLYNWQDHSLPQQDIFLPYYYSPKSFLTALLSEYRNIGYQKIALGGLLRSESTMPLGLKFGLSNEQFDELLAWSRPDFVLGGLALSRLAVLKKHNVWADSTNWLWWDARYDHERFHGRNPLQEVLA